ncbi:hypothetical protein Cgig2_030771 [Carnegiea gigantea]|uniref:Uncharacterized protein n=1 Tax=Carnegiea gigantea TaxID=171969 RepID=A0A9Q1KTQ6_9CARY|nr:hypothetical protein Cgig2_030771 [Carnegiea gigantea]
MTDAITRQVSEQVKRAMAAPNLARPLPHFDYIPNLRSEPSHQLERIPSPYYTEREREVRGHPMLRRLSPMTAPTMPQNARKYYEFHEQSGHTTTECQELKKALHELADKERPRFLRREQEPAQPQPQHKECSTEVVATIVGGYAKGMTRSAWKPSSEVYSRYLPLSKDPAQRFPQWCLVKRKPRGLPSHTMIP